MILLVAEKPSVANQHYKPMLERLEGEKFAQGDGCLIGKNHCITWCVGHLITLAPLDAYPGFEGGWKLSNLPLLPEKFRLKEIESTKKQLNVVQSMMEKADVLVNGADAGREGNLIFDLILDYTPNFRHKQIKRLWVNSYVAKDLDKAWKNLEDATQRINLSYAARLRQRADWMVGLNATRAYTLTAGRGKMISVGRVQTPTLNLIVERDSQVEGFQELFYYNVIATWKGFEAQLLKLEESSEKINVENTQSNTDTPETNENKKNKKTTKTKKTNKDSNSSDLKIAFFEKEGQAQAVILKCKAPKEATISKIEIQQKKQFPQKPFDLTELQKEGNKRFKFSAKQVLDCAQNLYEKKLLTYPRTDSQYLPESMKQEAYQLALHLADEKQSALIRAESEIFTFINSSKVTDHFAIIPTREVPQNLPEMEKKIYNLVKERFVQAWLKPYIWSEMDVELNCSTEFFRIKLKKNESWGFRELSAKTKVESSKDKEQINSHEDNTIKNDETTKDNDDLTNVVDVFPDWKIGDTAPFDTLDTQKKKKSRPKYYTEASLLAAMKTAGKQIENEELAEAMKERGLGTPATQAGIIETLKKRGFIEAKKNNLISTNRGREIIELMDEKIKSPEMTGEWEFKLSQVEKGNMSPVDFRDDIVEYIKQLFKELHTKYKNQFERETVTHMIPCPKCKESLEIAPWGYICKNTECGLKFSHTIAQRILSHEEMKTLLTNHETEALNGFKSKKGANFIAKLKLDDEWNIQFEFVNDGKFHGKATEYKCPLCKSPLEENKNTLFCTNSKQENTTEDNECKFTLFKTIAGHELIADEIQELFTNGSTPLIKGFKSKKGANFSAFLKFNSEGRVVFDFPKYDMPCPICKNQLKFQNGNAYVCINPQCAYSIPKIFYQRELSDFEIETLLKNKFTTILEPFKKNDTTFRAALEIKENGKIAFNKLTLEVIEKK